jgi:hypothetical protein
MFIFGYYNLGLYIYYIDLIELTRWKGYLMKAFLISSILTIAVFINMNCTAKEIAPVPEGLLEAAQITLDDLFSPATREYYRSCGEFTSQDDLSKVRLGRPLPEYLVTNEQILAAQDIEMLLDKVSIRSWMIPIYIEDVPKSVLLMKEENGKWRFFGLGGDAVNIDRIRGKYTLKDGFHHYVLKVNMTGTAYIGIEKTDADGQLIEYLEGAENYLGMRRGEDGLFKPISYNNLQSIIRKHHKESNIIQN